MKLVIQSLVAALMTATAAVSANAQSILSPTGLDELIGIKQVTQQNQTFAQTGASVGFKAKALADEQPDDNSLRICGSVIYPDNVIGIWSYGTEKWDPRRITINRIQATGGGVAVRDKYYCNTYLSMMGFEEIKTYSYLMSDWSEYDAYVGQINYVATTMAYNKDRDEVYGCFINAERNGYNLVQWNYDRYLPVKVICPLERKWSGCAFSSDGTLYAIENNGDLYKVNYRTGEMTLVGATGVTTKYVADAIIDPATDTMYWCVADDGNYGMYSVDIASAKATKLYDLENQEQICGMYIPDNKTYSDDVPAAVSSVSASFSGVSMSGKITFTTPRYTKTQTLLDADTPLAYTVKANGKVVATGEELPGKRVEAPVEMTETDNYNFVVTISNAAGESMEKNTKKYVGPDTPKAPTSFALSFNGNDVTLKWNSSSSTGVNGGNVDYKNVTYTVTRYPEGKVIVDNEAVTTVTDHIDTPEKRTDYYYTLVATASGLSSEVKKSNTISFGLIEPPYDIDFQTSSALAGWTLVGAGEADSKWAYYTYDKALRAYASAGFDDWAITPGIVATASVNYPVSVTVKTSSYCEETFDICWGTSPAPEAMTNVILADQKLKSTTPTVFSGEIITAEAGTIYIGIHAKTETKSNAIYVTALTIGEGKSVGVPAAVDNFTAESPVDGSAEATLRFNVPTKTLSGDDITDETAVTSIEIARDGNVIATITDALAPGAEKEYVDRSESLTLGTHTYSVVAVNANGRGNMVEKEVLVGARKPQAPASATMIEDGNSGKVTVSWEPVTLDIYGNTFKPEAVTYKVVNRNYDVVADNVTGTSVTLQAVEEGEQAFVQFGVYAVTAGGESDKLTGTAYKPVGKPYQTPWAESFKNGSVSSIFGYNYIKGQEPWAFVSTCDFNITPQDDDHGFAYFEAYGVYTALVTGKIDLDGIYNPTLTYYTFNYPMSSGTPTNAIEVQADCGDGNGFVTVQSNVVAETGPYGQWNKVFVHLSDYEGMSVVLRFVPKDAALAFYTLDNLRVSSYVESNLSVTNIEAPGVADAGKDFEVSVTVANTGERAVSSYTVELMRNGELADYVDCASLESGAVKVVTMSQTLSAIDGEDVTYKAVVVCSDDLVEEDNESEEITVGLVAPAVPVASELAATQQGDDVLLTWQAPDMSALPAKAFTESFENAESWGSAVEGWKFVDLDKAPVGGLNTPNFPITGLASWCVADRGWSGFEGTDEPDRWNGHTGKKFICSEYVQRSNQPVQSDDWAISPCLYGGTQAVAFYARSFDPSYLEDFEVLYSDNTTNTDDFVAVAYVHEVPTVWTLYRFKLPQGARYFAIRSRSTNKFFLFVDDITFIPVEGEPDTAELKGYNVYRNGAKVNTELVAEPAYTDKNVATGRDHSYYVTAIYDKGESSRSNEALFRYQSGIDSAMTGAVTVSSVPGAILVSGVADDAVTVCAVDGRVMYNAVGNGSVRIPVAPGIYIVSAAGTNVKVVVK